MKRNKTRGGFTLVELTVAIALLTILAAGIGGAMYIAYHNYNENQRKQEDEYNARNALVFITREIHRDAYVAEVEDASGGNSKLILKTYVKESDAGGEIEIVLEKQVEFFLDAGGELKCNVVRPDDYSVPFAVGKLELEKFEAIPSTDEDGNEDGRRIKLIIKCKNMSDEDALETSVALLRTQEPEEADEDEDA